MIVEPMAPTFTALRAFVSTSTPPPLRGVSRGAHGVPSGAHDAASVLIDSLTRRSNDLPLKKALIELGPFQGLQEKIQFDAYGDTQRSAAIAIIQNGRFVRQQP